MRRLLVCLAALFAVTMAGLAARDRPARSANTQAPAGPPAAAAAPSGDDDWVPTEVKNLTVLPKTTSPADVMKS